MLEQRIQQHFIDSADLKYQAAQVLSHPIASAVQAILACVTSGGKVLVCGNGPSAAAAQQFAAFCVAGFERERPELAALALAADSTLLTAGTAGMGGTGATQDVTQLFSRQVRALGQAGDVLLILSVSGSDTNLLAAAEAAHERDMTVLVLTGRTAGTQVEDEGIELRAINRISAALGDRAHVNVTSYNRQALLTGEVASAQDRQTVDQIMLSVENVRSVVNDLAVMPTTSLSQRSNDTFITGKVRASLVDAQDISANSFKVLTERNIVYLMGRVSQREAQRATDIARGVSGVTKVVRVFEIVSEEELRRIATQPPPVTTDSRPTPGG